MKLLSEDILERSAVVANCRMNRERNLTGSNGYAKELRFNPLESLREKATSGTHANWLDLCCGSGTALFEAAQAVIGEGLETRCQIVGVDLVGMFLPIPAKLSCLRLVEASLSNWLPDRQFDLISCVHGLHYIGDKLGLISRAVSWLTDDGRFAANLDVANIKVQEGHPASRIVTAALRESGFEYDARKKLVTCVGPRFVTFPFRYLGADNQAGPNYTGQAAVDSYYERANESSEALGKAIPTKARTLGLKLR
jgi:SAM-dependent methyltransferase